MPLECQPPVKAAHHRLICLHVELKCVPINGVNHWTYDGALILSNSEGKDNQRRKHLHYTLQTCCVLSVSMLY